MIQNSKHVFKAIFFASLFVICGLANAQIFKIKDSSILASSSIGKFDLLHNEDGFSIVKESEKFFVKECWVDPYLRSISNERLKCFLNFGKIFVNQMDNNEYSLQAKLSMKGGGPITGWFAYLATKTLCYGTAVAAATTAVVTTGGAVAGAVTAAGATVATSGAAAAASVTGAAIAGAGGGAAAATATGGAVAAAGGSIAAVVTAVEGASAAVGAFFCAIPFLP